MSLKGYQWYNDNNESVMTFTFKRLELDVWQDVSKKEYDEFIEFIKSRGYAIHSIDIHNHQIIGE